MPETDSRAEERLARAAWSRITEPGDIHAGTAIAQLGATGALGWLRANEPRPEALPPSPRACVERWAPRLHDLDPERDLASFARLGGRLVIPGDPEWPSALDDLGPAAPHALWVRGGGRLPGSEVGPPAVSVVGSRASTRYGEGVAREICFGLAEAGWSVVSGGAYGIDAAAHRGALGAGGGPLYSTSQPGPPTAQPDPPTAQPGPPTSQPGPPTALFGVPAVAGTVAVLAGGADRLYPAGNERLLAELMESGAVVAELAPGAAPTRHRFLARNRLIAALGAATVVVEAGLRSGALSTANHAVELLRPLGAVPGPVTSTASAGCHQLLREGKAVCLTSLEDVLELASPAGEGLPAGVREVQPGLLDGLDPLDSRVFDALPARASATLTSIVRTSGLSSTEVLTALGSLHIAGRVRRVGERWARMTS